MVTFMSFRYTLTGVHFGFGMRYDVPPQSGYPCDQLCAKRVGKAPMARKTIVYRRRTIGSAAYWQSVQVHDALHPLARVGILTTPSNFVA